MNKLLAFFIGMMVSNFIAMGQMKNFSGIIPSIFYRGNITDRFDYNIFMSTTYLPLRSAVEGRHSSRNSEIYIQPSLVYKFSAELNFAAGYTYIWNNGFVPVPETEQQVWQQVIFEHSALKGLMLHRIRFIEGVKKNTVTAFNYQIAFEIPLQGKVLDAGEFYFSAFNESFINLPGIPGLYSSNWTFAGLGYQTSSAGRIEAGPLIQTAFHAGRGNDTLYLLQVLWLFDSKILRRRQLLR